jgi:hypothetical protein
LLSLSMFTRRTKTGTGPLDGGANQETLMQKRPDFYRINPTWLG